MRAAELFTLPPSLAQFVSFFAPEAAPWAWVGRIAEALEAVPWAEFQPREDLPPNVLVSGHVYLHPSVKLPPYAVIEGPAWIGAGTEIRPGAYIRGLVIAGTGAYVLGRVLGLGVVAATLSATVFELSGPMNRMNRAISPICQGRGLAICCAPTLSVGMGTWEKS